MVFSRKQQLQDGIDKKIERAITMAKVAQNTDFKKAHPDWIRDAQNKNYSALKKQITESVKAIQVQNQARRDKLGGK